MTPDIFITLANLGNMENNTAVELLKAKEKELLAELESVQLAIAQLTGTLESRQDAGVG